MFLLDADLLFRRPINNLIEASESYDAVMAIGNGEHRGKSYRRFRVASGFVLFRRSGYALIGMWRQMLNRTEPVEDVRPWDWFWEQICLLDALENADFSVLQTPDNCLSSPGFERDAAVWSANVPRSEKPSALNAFMAELDY